MTKKRYNKEDEPIANQLDREGVITHATGDAEFDGKIGLRLHKSRPQETDFVGKYGPEEVAADLARVKEIEESPDYEKSQRPIAALAEYSITEGINVQELLGPGAKARLTSRYDDVEGGADLVVTVPDPDGGEITFSIDVTATGNKPKIKDKLVSEFLRLHDNNRTHLKYFPDLEDNLNRYVVGIPEMQVRKLSRMLLGKTSKPEQNEMAKAVIQLEMSNELIYQSFKQIEFILRRYKVYGRRIENIEELLETLEEKEEEIKKRLPRDTLTSVSESKKLMEIMMKRREEIGQKKEGALVAANQSSRVEPIVRHLTDFDPDQILVRAA